MKTGVSYAKREEILSNSFVYLVKNGLENTSIRAFGREIFGSASNMYVYFEDKNEWIVDTARYGLSKTALILLDYAFENMHNLKHFSETIMQEVEKQQAELRVICQVAASPLYGEVMRNKATELMDTYFDYIEKLGKLLDCDPVVLTPSIFNLISIILDFVVWNDKPVTEMQMSDWYTTMMMKLGREGK